jgi:hypothetical protein
MSTPTIPILVPQEPAPTIPQRCPGQYPVSATDPSAGCTDIDPCVDGFTVWELLPCSVEVSIGTPPMAELPTTGAAETGAMLGLAFALVAIGVPFARLLRRHA